MTEIVTTKDLKLRRLQIAEQKVGQLFSRHTMYHWYRILPDDSVIDYWPTTNKWQHGNKVCAGNVDALIAYLEKHGE